RRGRRRYGAPRRVPEKVPDEAKNRKLVRWDRWKRNTHTNRMDRAARLRQPKELVARPWLLREGSPCRRSLLTPPAGASSCSSWPEVRCSPPEDLTPLPAKGLRPAASFPIR